jgi:hypothetical protein
MRDLHFYVLSLRLSLKITVNEERLQETSSYLVLSSWRSRPKQAIDNRDVPSCDAWLH